ncbi:MAG: choice-of-anchor J domain-containing protein [Ignavibacteria bacterium]|nr:choice-of-anchor J domain-containing protein [Ignavibacteria bacterium]
MLLYTWTTGGAVGNDQWLITPQLTNMQSNEVLNFSLRYWPPGTYRDSIEVLISTNTPTIPDFTTLVFRKNFLPASLIQVGFLIHSQ